MTCVIAGSAWSKLRRWPGAIALICTQFFVVSAIAGTASLSWIPPTENADGTPLTDLASYRIYWGCSGSREYPFQQTIPAPQTTYVVEGLPDDGTCYFAATAINAQGAESAYSNEASVTFAVEAPGKPAVAIEWSDGQTIMVTQVITHNTTVQNATADEQFTGITDTWLGQTNPTTNWETDQYFYATKWEAGNHRHGLLRANLVNIPAGATISSATLYLRMSANIGAGSHTFTVRALLPAVVYTEATWNIFSTGNNWTTAGALSNGNDRSTTTYGTMSGVDSTIAWRSVDITTLVQGWHNGTITNRGLHFERTDGANDSTQRAFESSNGGDGIRPELVIVYTVGRAARAAAITLAATKRASFH